MGIRDRSTQSTWGRRVRRWRWRSWGYAWVRIQSCGCAAPDVPPPPQAMWGGPLPL
eukprot:NODE_32_length_2477_cov_114.914745_g25_i0.p18 GENE.NODE_32_length_2477_cov_114.914745_g25_i0~~NODE_32_length_2477_cov_114.914745_g25_i0.p18  ORF type:complete len:56 (-),score=10.03 NODE_32_length_2477_cov_114.914745_g25_i0:1118-1285(-)